MEYFLPDNYSSWSKIYYRISSDNSQYWNLENKQATNKKHLLIISNKKVYLIYSNIDNDKLIIEETLVNIDNIEKDNIYYT